MKTKRFYHGWRAVWALQYFPMCVHILGTCLGDGLPIFFFFFLVLSCSFIFQSGVEEYEKPAR